jgi:aspergillopepsin I
MDSSSWVFSSLLPAEDLTNHEYYTSSSSPTYNALPGNTWSIIYGDGSSASGIVGTDTVSVGDTVITNQGIELANTISWQYQEGSADGVLGLAFDSLNSGKYIELSSTLA